MKSMDIVQSVHRRLIPLLNSSPLFGPKKTLIVAVSGGVDSVVLLDLLSHFQKQKEWTLIVAHLNYALRGEDSQKDAALVKKIASEKKISFKIKTLKGEEWKKKGNLQEEARNIRYRFFATIAQKHKADAIITAHHADDQAETFFLRLIRGAGSEGLQGMTMQSPALFLKNTVLLRPLLIFERQEILSYARARKLTWREDISNQQEKYLRNFVRLKLLGPIKKKNPRFVSQMAQSIGLLAEDNLWIQKELEKKVFQKIAVSKTLAWVKIALKELMKQETAVRYRIYRELFRKTPLGLKGIQKKHLDTLEEMVIFQKKKMRVTFPLGWGAFLKGNELFFECWRKGKSLKKRGFFS